METSQEVGALAEALSKAQAEIKGASKDSDNPFFKSKYADLASVWEACRTALTNHGIAVIQGPSVEGNLLSVTTMLLHLSGQWSRSVLSTTLKDQSPQVVGSATTYLRRYGLAAMAGVAPHDDDDGNAAQGNTVSRADKRETERAAGAKQAAEHGPYSERERQRAADVKAARDTTASNRPAEIVEDFLESPAPKLPPLPRPGDHADILKRMEAWSPAARAAIPPDEALFLFPEPDAEANRQLYIDGILDAAVQRGMSPTAQTDIKERFTGSRRSRLMDTNIWLLRALWIQMTQVDTETA